MSPHDAFEYVRDRWEAFLDAYPEILEMQHHAAEVAYAAKEAGDTETYEAARELIQELGDLAQRHNWAVLRYDQLTEFVPGLGSYGLGQVPAAYAAAIVALAAVMVYVLAQMDAARRVLSLLDEGKVSPDEARALLNKSPLGDLGQLVKWGSLAFLAWAGVKAIQEFRA